MSKKNIFISGAFIALALIACVSLTLIFGSSEQSEDVSALNNVSEKTAQEPFCMLIMGKDRASGLSDVIMLASFDMQRDRICVMQLPRDTYAEYTEKSYRKLNAAPKILGNEGFCAFLSDNLGVRIDGYVSLDLDAFRLAVDAIGGVEMTLDKPLNYEDPAQNLYIHLPAGKQTLDGAAAEKLVRFRSGYIRGDIDRLDVQKSFLASFFVKAKQEISRDNAYAIADELLPYIKTNINSATLTALGLKAMNVDESDLLFATLPGEDAVEEASRASYYVMSARPTDSVLSEFFGKEVQGIDEGGVFLHPKYEKFKEIYSREATIEPISAENLKK